MGKSAAFNPFEALEKQPIFIPEELATACKKIWKKETQTKLKGFTELSSWIDGSHDLEAFRDEFVLYYILFFLNF